MKKYKVTLQLMVDAVRDSDKDNPETVDSIHFVEAESPFGAYRVAMEQETSLVSIFDYKAIEV